MHASRRVKIAALAGAALIFAGVAGAWYVSPLSKPRAGDNARPVAVMQALIIRVEELYDTGYDGDWRGAQDALVRVQRTAARLYGRDLYWEGRWNISRMAEALLPRELDAIAGAIDRRDRDGFLTHFRALVIACNACHEATRQMVVVEEPPRQEQRRRAGGTRRGSAGSYSGSANHGIAAWPSPNSITSMSKPIDSMPH